MATDARFEGGRPPVNVWNEIEVRTEAGDCPSLLPHHDVVEHGLARGVAVTTTNAAVKCFSASVAAGACHAGR